MTTSNWHYLPIVDAYYLGDNKAPTAVVSRRRPALWRAWAVNTETRYFATPEAAMKWIEGQL